jgi:hypothetical protein
MLEARQRPRPRSSTARPAAVSRRAALAAAGLLAGALVAACGPGPTAAPPSERPPSERPPSLVPTASPAPTPGATASESPTASPEDTGSGVAACVPADLKASHGIVEGTAGSRETEVVLVTAVRCALPAWPDVQLRDGLGVALVAGSSGGSGETVVQPGGSYVSAVQLSNWCGAEPAYPLTLDLLLDGESVAVSGGPFADEGDLPPCAGGDLPILSGTAWTPSS